MVLMVGYDQGVMSGIITYFFIEDGVDCQWKIFQDILQSTVSCSDWYDGCDIRSRCILYGPR